MDNKINPIAFGVSGAIVSALVMFLLGILGNMGIYSGAANMMAEWHMFSSSTFGGTIAGIIEAAIISFVFLYLFAWVYNKIVK